MNLKVNFLNVGHGDSTVLEFPSGNLTVIDINNCKLDEKTKNEIYEELRITGEELFRQKYFTPNFDEYGYLKAKGYDIELTDPVDWLMSKKQFSIFRFICTHPDMDHISGLHKIKKSSIKMINFWDIEHSFEQTEANFDGAKYSYDDWLAYKGYRTSTDSPKAINPLRDHTGDYWSQDGISILSPNEELIKIAQEKDDSNLLSYVILVKHGKTKIYLCGDATEDITIPDILNHYGEDFFKKKEGETVILKAPHHGRDSGYNQKFVELLQPDCVIVSVGKKPETDACNKYRSYSDNVWTTRWKGNIGITCDVYGNYIPDFQYKR